MATPAVRQNAPRIPAIKPGRTVSSSSRTIPATINATTASMPQAYDSKLDSQAGMHALHALSIAGESLRRRRCLSGDLILDRFQLPTHLLDASRENRFLFLR